MSLALEKLVVPAVATAITFAIFVGLGAWQLRRLDEKEALIARVERGYNEAPTEAPQRDEWHTLTPDKYEYRHVRVTGQYEGGREALVFAVTPEGFGNEPGFNVVTPFRLASGGVILVERGFAPRSKATADKRAAPPSGELTLTGHLRAPQPHSAFTPADDPARGLFFTRDPAVMAKAMGIDDVAPFTLALDAPGDASADAPRPIPHRPTFPNSHLQYALTWFGLALADILIFVIYARRVIAREA
ncbi:MAG: SURF1 family protein [Methylocystis sp.]|nr:SURF1 family protein [Methylocystis sp.]